MPSTLRHSITPLAVLLACTMGVPGRTSFAQDHAKPEIALTPGTCATVAEGDIVTLQWNPAFTPSWAVTGVENFGLTFAKNGDGPRSAAGGNGITLHAFPPQRNAAHADNPITPMANGLYQLRFRVALPPAAAGEYHLIAAESRPQISSSYHGDAPAMTNSPTSLPFCLNVVGSTSRGR